MSKNTSEACNFLASLQRFDLALLLKHCRVALEEREIDNYYFSNLVHVAIIEAPTPIGEALENLNPQDRKRICEAVAILYSTREVHDEIEISKTDDSVGGPAALISELLIHRNMMINVATGGQRIEDVNDYYRARETRIRQYIPEDIKYENPHRDLWEWYNYWSSNLAQWKDRRLYVRQLFGPAIDAVSKRSSWSSEPREPTGWERVDRGLSKARSQLEIASAEEDCQAIGLLCREIIISLAQAVYDPKIHDSLDGIQPSGTDSNRMLEAYIAHAFPGASNKEVRAHARASLALALNLQHRRTANRQLAALCVEATASTSAVISIIARKDVN